jgi:hypothetical protein
MKAHVFTKGDAIQEEKNVVSKNPNLKGKSRTEMGLAPFTETQIRSNICGLNLMFTKQHFIKLLDLEDEGQILSKYKT